MIPFFSLNVKFSTYCNGYAVSLRFQISILNLDKGSLLLLYLNFTDFPLHSLSIIIPCDLPLNHHLPHYAMAIAFKFTESESRCQRTIHRCKRLLVLGFEEQAIGMVSEFLAR
jgi:hypothetical protein